MHRTYQSVQIHSLENTNCWSNQAAPVAVTSCAGVRLGYHSSKCYWCIISIRESQCTTGKPSGQSNKSSSMFSLQGLFVQISFKILIIERYSYLSILSHCEVQLIYIGSLCWAWVNHMPVEKEREKKQKRVHLQRAVTNVKLLAAKWDLW